MRFAATLGLVDPMTGDWLRRMILRALPWYRADEVEARHALNRRAVLDARRILRVREDYQRADERVGRMSGH